MDRTPVTSCEANVMIAVHFVTMPCVPCDMSLIEETVGSIERMILPRAERHER